jgi:uncharacterized membrane protein
VTDLVVIVFDDENSARDALKDLRKLEHEGAIHFEDTAVLSKDHNGKVHVKNEVSGTTETGAVAGGALGLLLMFLFPGVGIILGAAAGAAIGAMLGEGVDRNFVKELSQSLEPGKSALFLMIKAAQPAFVDALKPYKGQVYQTTLSEDVEKRLARALA